METSKDWIRRKRQGRRGIVMAFIKMCEVKIIEGVTILVCHCGWEGEIDKTVKDLSGHFCPGCEMQLARDI